MEGFAEASRLDSEQHVQMYTTEPPESPDRYQELHIDGNVFYKMKKTGECTEPVRRRRYSDQFKDPLFIQKDISRKLRMMKQFRESHGNLEELIERWKDCIFECVSILQSKYDMPPAAIFKMFNLKRHGFDPLDYGVCEE